MVSIKQYTYQKYVLINPPPLFFPKNFVLPSFFSCEIINPPLSRKQRQYPYVFSFSSTQTYIQCTFKVIVYMHGWDLGSSKQLGGTVPPVPLVPSVPPVSLVPSVSLVHPVPLVPPVPHCTPCTKNPKGGGVNKFKLQKVLLISSKCQSTNMIQVQKIQPKLYDYTFFSHIYKLNQHI